MSSYRAEGAVAEGRRDSEKTMHGLSCKALQGKNKAPRSFKRKQAQDADPVHSKPSDRRESAPMNPGSVLRLSLQMSTHEDQLLTQHCGGGVVLALQGLTFKLKKAGPTGCLYLTPH